MIIYNYELTFVLITIKFKLFISFITTIDLIFINDRIDTVTSKAFLMLINLVSMRFHTLYFTTILFLLSYVLCLRHGFILGSSGFLCLYEIFKIFPSLTKSNGFVIRLGLAILILLIFALDLGISSTYWLFVIMFCGLIFRKLLKVLLIQSVFGLRSICLSFFLDYFVNVALIKIILFIIN